MLTNLMLNFVRFVEFLTLLKIGQYFDSSFQPLANTSQMLIIFVYYVIKKIIIFKREFSLERCKNAKIFQIPKSVAN